MTVKTSVYLDDDDKRRLALLAETSGTSEAELLRRGVRMVLDAATRPRPRMGVAASRDGKYARNADKLLQDTGFGTV